MNKHIPALAAAGALVLGGCASATTGNEDSGTLAESGTSAVDTPVTIAQQNAINSAQAYLGTGVGYSRFGLIRLLVSQAGGGFARADAVFAVEHILVNWQEEAVLAAREYLADGGSSREGLFRRLGTRAGEGFTHAQATYAADAVGL